MHFFQQNKEQQIFKTTRGLFIGLTGLKYRNNQKFN